MSDQAKDRGTALMFAVRLTDIETLRARIKDECEMSRLSWHVAFQWGRSDVCEVQLYHGGDERLIVEADRICRMLLREEQAKLEARMRGDLASLTSSPDWTEEHLEEFRQAFDEARRRPLMVMPEAPAPLFVVVVENGALLGTYLDEERAREFAKNVHGLLCSMPIIADYRE